MKRDARARWARCGTVFVIALIVRIEQLVAADAKTSGDARPIEVLAVAASAVRDAAAKLEGTACQQIFTDFRDRSGRTLQQNLDALDRTGQNYLQLTLFYEGNGRPICDERGILASTSPGSRVIFIRSTQFAEVAHRNPGLAAALIIHEELHSLGLGENPPTSKAITAQVIARCGK